jgi:Fuc2NAc and GlcNAc transferase
MTAATILELALPAVAALLASLWLTGVVRRMALRRGVLDVPNSRSSHAVPTPRGGGLAIVVALYGVLSYQTLAGGTARPVIVALAGGLPVALIGLIDDNRPVTPLLRLVVHIAAAAWAVAWLGGMPPIQVGAGLVGLGPLGPLFGVLAISWMASTALRGSRACMSVSRAAR